MSYPTGPLRVTPEQWADIREHYEDPSDYDEPEDELEDEEEPVVDDHDRRFSDQYDTANGDIEVDYDYLHARWDDDPSPYDGTYSEE